ncbi:MAG: hypothetical protein ISR43_06185 [Acidimicrobiia bacterium]|nr:hypothetical protein [Actinomycetota bacterium]MBL6925387.1 hypothetical protein [Acidimicrobiia bacterium]MBL6926803.1 hypothetical protein [Acidimicrobiia bacterium]
MKNRFARLAYLSLLPGVLFLVASAVTYSRVQEGYDSLQAFSEAQNVTLNYNEAGQLIDRGSTEGADAILALLTEDWNYPVVDSDLDPNSPLVNTGTEYMYQMATIVSHTLHGTQTVILEQDVEYKGELFTAGEHKVEVDGKYWTDFDRRHPLEGPARDLAWSGTVHGLVGELGVGTVTHSTLQLGLGLAAVFGALGLTFLLTGAGVIWVTKADS